MTERRRFGHVAGTLPRSDPERQRRNRTRNAADASGVERIDKSVEIFQRDASTLLRSILG